MRTSVLALAAAGVAGMAATAMGQFTEQFESLAASTVGTPPGAAVALPSGAWFFVNNSVPIGPTGVSRLPTAAGGTSPWVVNPGDGSFYASMNFNNTASSGSDNLIDSYFMTPVLNLENGDTISFITRTATDPAPTFPDRLRVKMSTAGASTSGASFTITLLSINEALGSGVADYPQVWTPFTATVSGLGGPTSGRVAFNYNVPMGGFSGANSNIIGIDRVQYTKVPEPASLALLAGAIPMLLRRRA